MGEYGGGVWEESFNPMSTPFAQGKKRKYKDSVFPSVQLFTLCEDISDVTFYLF